MYGNARHMLAVAFLRGGGQEYLGPIILAPIYIASPQFLMLKFIGSADV